MFDSLAVTFISSLNELIDLWWLPAYVVVMHFFSVFLRIVINKFLSYRKFIAFTFIGVVIHEISHALAAIITLNVPVKIKLFDLKAADGTHGHVHIRPLPISFLIFPLLAWQQIGGAILIGIAPLLSPILIYYFHTNLLEFLNIYPLLWPAACWIIFSLLCQMELSIQDFKLARRGLLLAITSLIIYKIGITALIMTP